MVRQAYRDILRREPDRSGLRQYMDALLSRGWSDADVRRSLMDSPEYAQRFGSARSGWRAQLVPRRAERLAAGVLGLGAAVTLMTSLALCGIHLHSDRDKPQPRPAKVGWP